MHEYTKRLDTAIEEIAASLETVNIPEKEKTLVALEQEMLAPTFWDDREHAEHVSSRVKHMQDTIDNWTTLAAKAKELRELCDVLTDQDIDEVTELAEQLDSLEQRLQSMMTTLYLNEKYDEHGAYLTIHSGMGGLDAEEFTHMLLRMYTRFCEHQGWKVELYEKHDNNQGGCKYAHMEIRGPLAYGMLKAERGVHRLVRLSPYKSSDSRQTSFAGVEILPILEKQHHVEIKADDLRIDTYRASGAGGQHVNTTDSAVRITHIPTNIVVTCQNERSQAQNKDRAMNILQAKLIEHMEAEEAKKQQELRGDHLNAEWGNQIRSYVLHPYKQVKDHRTDLEHKDPDKVFDGDIMPFIEAWLRWRKG